MKSEIITTFTRRHGVTGVCAYLHISRSRERCVLILCVHLERHIASPESARHMGHAHIATPNPHRTSTCAYLHVTQGVTADTRVAFI